MGSKQCDGKTGKNCEMQSSDIVVTNEETKQKYCDKETEVEGTIHKLNSQTQIPSTPKRVGEENVNKIAVK